MRLIVFGDPIAHSLSPSLHTAALESVGMGGSYTTRRVDAASVESVFDEMRSGALDGANVTMPHKRAAARFCDALSPEAARADAANTLVRIGRKINGHNTDVPGLRTAWEDAGLGQQQSVLVLGAGGAAAAAVIALAADHDLYVAARRRDRAEALVAAVDVAAQVIGWGEPLEGVVVNTTPLGMHGEELPGPVQQAATGVFDMAYAHEETPAVADARAIGLPVATGQDLLVAQAALSFRLWTGRDPSLAAMRAGMIAEMARRRTAETP